jgi:hypothetical protein
MNLIVLSKPINHLKHSLPRLRHCKLCSLAYNELHDFTRTHY